MLTRKKIIGLILLVLSTIEFLIIKNHYRPNRTLRIEQLLSMTGFMLTVIVAIAFLLTGVRRNYRG